MNKVLNLMIKRLKMMNKINTSIILIILFFISLVGAGLIGYLIGQKPPTLNVPPPTRTRIDTLKIIDTIEIKKTDIKKITTVVYDTTREYITTYPFSLNLDTLDTNTGDTINIGYCYPESILTYTNRHKIRFATTLYINQKDTIYIPTPCEKPTWLERWGERILMVGVGFGLGRIK